MTDAWQQLIHDAAEGDPGELAEATEYKGQWPGGWKEDEHGNLAFAIRQSGEHRGEDAPVWACVLCQKGQLHTLAEHERILSLATKR